MYCPNCGKYTNKTPCINCGKFISPDFFGANSETEEDRANFDDSTDSYDDKYSKEFDEYTNSYDDEKKRRNQKRTIIILSSVAAVVLIILIALIIINSINAQDKDIEVKSSAEEIENEKNKRLMEKAELFMSTGDYDSCEEIYKKIIDSENYDDESMVLYKIVYNYNRAKEEYEDKNYSEAEKLLNKIPSEYSDYQIAFDVDELTTNAGNGKTAYDSFKNVQKYIEEQDYANAEKAVSIVDEEYLSDQDKNLFHSYKDELKEKTSSSGKTDTVQIEALLKNYCPAFVEAVNKNDFDIVSPYMHKSGSMYETQRKLLDYYVQKGITESFQNLTIHSITPSDKNTWRVSVTEEANVMYSNGTSENKTYNLTYTVKYIDSDYFLMKVE